MTPSNPNICLHYLYRDGGNYKNYGEVVFNNPLRRSLSEVDALLQSCLIEGLFFVAADWGVPDLHFTEYPYDESIDHDWHEYGSVSETTEEATADLEMFLERVQSVIAANMNEKKVPVVRKDKSLNPYSNQVLFPEKVAKARQAVEKLGMPKLEKKNES